MVPLYLTVGETEGRKSVRTGQDVEHLWESALEISCRWACYLESDEDSGESMQAKEVYTQVCPVARYRRESDLIRAEPDLIPGSLF